MASSPYSKEISLTGTSSSGRLLTPSSSSSSATHASAAGTNNTTATGAQQPWVPTYPLQHYLAQPATHDSVPYGRLAGRTGWGAADPESRIAFYTACAERAIDRYDLRFGSP
ncbi:uncharacterized protein THITE_2093289 [Thermothielavioides terrestris NRRL 8126]|uniref:Uncharacterized protein n=1 Tax=Thermothielavioides terrestris (strain ATCC 38088 / NRRL 8126) TaxID=578455 RepID=G2RG39_THETT|nr:uncharacterized protein THITE_2093289 [Thermothielavioides terrestris NRRL 8126]AEO71793.1 hypothetical protein THITE_2093289 [Thermothielavioides terrestris NRRL 8126]